MENLTVKFKKLHKDVPTPKYAIEGDVGVDLTAISMNIVEKEDYGYIQYDTGVAVEIPKGFYGHVVPRSSISKTGMILSNSAGVIDQGFRDTIKARFKWIKGTKRYEIGDRICQLIILPIPEITYEEVDKLSSTTRDKGSFGSTGN